MNGTAITNRLQNSFKIKDNNLYGSSYYCNFRTSSFKQVACLILTLAHPDLCHHFMMKNIFIWSYMYISLNIGQQAYIIWIYLHFGKNITCTVIKSLMIPPLFGKQEVRIWRVKKRFPRYGVSIWSLWPNTRFLPSIVAEKNVHICSMCIKTN